MGNKKPQARINSSKSINKAIQTSKAYLDQTTVDNVRIHISAGNMKLGAIMNISLPPVVTCHNCHSCKNYCYAIRSYNRLPDTATAWNENLLLFKTDPNRYFYEISRAVKTQRFFRWHVSGDIVNDLYLAGMIKVAYENPKCEFLAFTKAYEIVNNAVDTWAIIPSNLHLLFSAAPGNEMHNPHKIPECHINFEDTALNTYCGGAEYEYHCTGNCTECAVNGCGCFFLKNGDVTIIDQH